MSGMSDFDFRAFNLNLLPALQALLVERNVSRAAARSGVSQSAMSHSLAKLRQLFADPLLVASGGGLTITPRAEALLASLPTALDDLRRALAPPEDFDPSTSTRTFSLATHDCFEFTALADVLSYLRDHAPKVRLDVQRFSTATVPRLRTGDIDLLVTGVSAKVPITGLRRRLIHEEPFAVIARPGHPVFAKRLTLKNYLSADHVLICVDGQHEGIVDRVLRSQGLHRNVTLRVPHFASAPVAVLGSDLICTLARSVAVQGRKLFGVKVFEPPLEIPKAGVAAYWPRQHDGDVARTWFRELLIGGRVLPGQTRKPVRGRKES